MSDHDMVIANGSGATVRADINAALLALVSWHSGASAPSQTYPYMRWFDTVNNLLKVRDAADAAWVTVASLSGTVWKPFSEGSAVDAQFAGIAAENVFTENQEIQGTAATVQLRLNRTDGALLDFLALNRGILRTTDATDLELHANSSLIAKLTSGGGMTVGSSAVDQGAGTLNAENGLFVGGAAVGGGMSVGGSLVLASGTGGSITDLGGVTDPDRIEFSITDIDPSGSDHLMITIGDSGGEETSGYDSRSISVASGGTNLTAKTDGFVIRVGSGGVLSGRGTLVHKGSNLWGMSFVGDDETNVVVASGEKTLTATLDRVVFGLSGANTFSGANGAAKIWAGKAA